MTKRVERPRRSAAETLDEIRFLLVDCQESIELTCQAVGVREDYVEKLARLHGRRDVLEALNARRVRRHEALTAA